ncbi:MAG: amidohydrolase family protein, partial [Alphaproteobacteria bacterium]
MFDLLIRGATLFDGTGKPGFVADLGVKNGKIKAIGKLPEARAEREVDAAGKFLTPGFVDIHSHSDLAASRDNNDRLMEPLIRQGITTFVGGNCGLGLAPLPAKNRDFNYTQLEGFTARKVQEEIQWDSMGEYLDLLEQQGLAMNMAMLVPHGILRIGALGPETRHAHPDEVAQMARWLEQALEEGAVGMSTGLQYFPGSQSEVTELIDLGRVIARKRGVFTSHLRSYSATLPQAVDE